MMTTRTLFTRTRFWLFAITLLGGLLRFSYLLQIEHNTDRAYPIWQALMTLEHGALPLIGQGTSVLFANPPGMGYLLLPVMALTHSALGAYLFVIALNTLGIWFTYKAVRLITRPRAALVASFLMAVNPWMIEYSRLTWVQGLLPFLVPALAWALWSALLGTARNPGRRLLLALILLTIAAQTYLLAFALVIPVGVTVIVFWMNPHPQTASATRWRRGMIRGLIAGGVIFAVFGVVYAMGLLEERDMVGAQLAHFGENPAHLSGEALSHAIRLVTGQDYAAARGVDAPAEDAAQRQELSQIAHVVLLAALMLGAALSIWRAVRRDRRGLLPLIWFGVPILLMSYVGQPVHPFYQLLGIPAGFALAGTGLDTATRALVGRFERQAGGGRYVWSPYSTTVLGVLAILFGILMTINSIRYAQETWRYPGAHGLTALSLEYGLELGDFLRDRASDRSTVFADADGWILPSLAGKTLNTVRDTRVPNVMIFPHDGGFYVSINNRLPARYEDTFNALVTTLRDGNVIRINVLSAGMSVFQQRNIDVTSTNGVRPFFYALDSVNGVWTLTTEWVLDDPLPERTDQRLFAPFAHIFNADGSRALIVDGQAVPGYEWRPGDVHVHRMRFTLPEDGHPPYTLAIGQYDADHDQNAIFILQDGTYTPLITLPDQLDPTSLSSTMNSP